MRRTLQVGIFFFLCFGLTSMMAHKFYVAIHQVNFAKEKKMLQITSRLFVDDINEALEKKHHQKCDLASQNDTPEQVEFLKKYLTEKFRFKVNGQPKTLEFLSKETEDNVLICYLRIKEVTKISSLEIENTMFMEHHDEQQHIIQTQFNGSKQSLLLTAEKTKGMLK